MTPKWRESLERARAAKREKAAARGSVFRSPETKLRAIQTGLRNLANHSAKGQLASARNRFVMPKTRDPIMQQIFDLIRKSGTYQRDIMDRAGIDRGSFKRWRSGKHYPNFQSIVAVLTVLGAEMRIVQTKYSSADVQRRQRNGFEPSLSSEVTIRESTESQTGRALVG